MSLKNHEWPSDVLDYMTDSIIDLAKDLRALSGVPMIPSPVPEAHVRFVNSSSRHAVGSDGRMKKSSATDLYIVNNTDAAALWRHACSMSRIGGLGIYFDTIYGGKKRVMFHIDERPDRLLWICPSRDRSTEKREYIYYRDANPAVYLDLLSVELERVKNG